MQQMQNSPPPILPDIFADVILKGDITKLSAVDKVKYYNEVCSSIGLNPLTKPFEYIVLNNKERLYAAKGCTDQLRKIYAISIEITSRAFENGAYIVTARASNAEGRTDEDIGAVNVEGLKGEAFSNAIMKAQTKAKRRVTLSFCGLGMLDESELDDIAEVKQRRKSDAPPVVRMDAVDIDGEDYNAIYQGLLEAASWGEPSLKAAWEKVGKAWRKLLEPKKEELKKIAQAVEEKEVIETTKEGS